MTLLPFCLLKITEEYQSLAFQFFDIYKMKNNTEMEIRSQIT